MSNLKRTADNFPKMKVRGKARRKRNAIRRLEYLIEARTQRFDKAMAILGGLFGQVGMNVTVTDEAIQDFKKANEL